MSTGGFAGHCDWRVPTVIELQTILLAPYPCDTIPCIDAVFGPTSEGYHWTATTYAGAAGNALLVPFNNGQVGYAAKNLPATYGARAVRPFPSGRPIVRPALLYGPSTGRNLPW